MGKDERILGPRALQWVDALPGEPENKTSAGEREEVKIISNKQVEKKKQRGVEGK